MSRWICHTANTTYEHIIQTHSRDTIFNVLTGFCCKKSANKESAAGSESWKALNPRPS